ncbi:PAP2 superfamily protein [Maritalea mobilis]|uniref:PAP2 superfamily protein n=2 Tax=Maritalea mobilis TaxID=483324 RepID=A0A4R6VQF4_9HYPH|nr:PAP2 superfamily protein [Maritalea mobilis]
MIKLFQAHINPSNRALAWLSAFYLCFLTIILIVAIFFDKSLSNFFTTAPEPVISFFEWTTDVGKSNWMLIPSLLIWLLTPIIGFLGLKYSLYWKARAITGLSGFIFLGIGLPGLATNLMKRAIGRARPMHLEEFGTTYFQPHFLMDKAWTFQSFPSGHTTTSFAAAVVVFLLAGRRWGAVAFMLAGFVAISRLVIGAHFVTDVLAGSLVGTMGALAVHYLYVRKLGGFKLINGANHVQWYAPFKLHRVKG